VAKEKKSERDDRVQQLHRRWLEQKDKDCQAAAIAYQQLVAADPESLQSPADRSAYRVCLARLSVERLQELRQRAPVALQDELQDEIGRQQSQQQQRARKRPPAAAAPADKPSETKPALQ
jgi:hypothetical protein